MEYRQEIAIPQAQLQIINDYLHVEPTSIDECLDEDETIIYTANFGNGVEMDIKCCGVQYHPDEDCNTAYSEAVLFYHGSEVGCEYGEDEFEGEWMMDYDGDTYIVNIISA